MKEQSINQLAFISYMVVYRPFQELIQYSCPVQVSKLQFSIFHIYVMINIGDFFYLMPHTTYPFS